MLNIQDPSISFKMSEPATIRHKMLSKMVSSQTSNNAENIEPISKIDILRFRKPAYIEPEQIK